MIDPKKDSELSKLYLLVGAIGLIYLAHAIYFPGLFLEGDALRHYQISRYSWKHPILFMDLWGKPFFTLLSSPFSQFGLMGIKVFNIICALLSCICVFNIAKKMEMPRPLLAPLILGFTVLFFFMAISGFTELLFGLMLVFCIWQYLRHEFFWSTILISFLPLVRSEGNLLLPLFFIILVLSKKYWNVFLLGAGTLIYSVVGYFVYEDFFWLQSQNPYAGNALELYGRGPLLHFIQEYSAIWGRPVAFLAMAGLISLIVQMFRGTIKEQKFSREEIILIYGSLFVYLVAHSIFWWKGIFNSLGLVRVMGAVMTVSALLALRGFNFILSFFEKNRMLSRSLGVIMLACVIFIPFHKDYFPLKPDGEELAIQEVKKWYDSSDLKNKNHKLYYLHPNLPRALAFDPFDIQVSEMIWGFYTNIEKYGYEIVPDSSLVFWDAHYAANEGGTSFEALMADTNFRLIKSFTPRQTFMVLGNRPFEIHIFQKLKREIRSSETILEEKFDFETDAGTENNSTLSDQKAASGKRSSALNPNLQFSVLVRKQIDSLPNAGKINCIKLSLKLWGTGNISTDAVLTIHKGDEQVAYYSYPVNHDFSNSKDWADINCQWTVDSEILKNADYIKIYIWNNKNLTFNVDDFDVRYLTTCF